MKRIIPFLNLFIISNIWMSCNNANPSKSEAKAMITHKECYFSTYEKDTAIMEINYFNNMNIKGKLKINYGNGALNNGHIEGKFKGDTLFVTYKVSTANLARGSFTNPLVFLARNNQLNMGIGQIETTLGNSYFVKDKPINFSRSKFIFDKTNCK